MSDLSWCRIAELTALGLQRQLSPLKGNLQLCTTDGALLEVVDSRYGWSSLPVVTKQRTWGELLNLYFFELNLDLF